MEKPKQTFWPTQHHVVYAHHLFSFWESGVLIQQGVYMISLPKSL